MQPASFSHLAPELSRVLATWRPEQNRDGFVVVSVPAPLVPLESVFVAGESGESFLWAPSGEMQFVAEGVAAEVSASGPGRFEAIKNAATRLLGLVKCPEARAPQARMFGGFSFQPATPKGALWRGFDAARFVLPRSSYASDGQNAWISLSVAEHELGRPAQVAELINRSVTWLEGLLGRASSELAQPSSMRLDNLPDLEGWRDLVNGIKAEISGGAFQKIVAARRAVCRLEPAPGADQVLLRLAAIAQDCTRFAVRRGDKLFLGATPEWLLRKRGRRLRTEALAGSHASRDADGEQHLLSSQKDLGEHALVVDAILAALGPLTSELSAPTAPAVRRLRDILHLYTPINGTLHTDTHVLDLIERLHPTPAVGGTPHPAAHRWIGEHESEERGWYASPVGWLDAAGDGQFVVALRSALMVGSTAHIFAGAGIVAESDAELEFEETELKLKAMIHALGAS